MAIVLELLSWVCIPVGAVLLLVAVAIGVAGGRRQQIEGRLVRIDEYGLLEWHEDDGLQRSRTATPHEMSRIGDAASFALFLDQRTGDVRLQKSGDGEKLIWLVAMLLLGIGIVCAILSTVLGAAGID